MKRQCKVLSVGKKIQILAKVDAHMGTQVDPAAVLGLSVSTSHKIVSKWPEIEKSYSCYGPSFSREPRSLKNWKLSVRHASSKPVLPVLPLMDSM